MNAPMPEWKCQSCMVVHIQEDEPLECLNCGCRAFYLQRAHDFGIARNAWGQQAGAEPTMRESYPFALRDGFSDRPFHIPDPDPFINRAWAGPYEVGHASPDADALGGRPLIQTHLPLPRPLSPSCIDAVEAGIELAEQYANDPTCLGGN